MPEVTLTEGLVVEYYGVVSHVPSKANGSNPNQSEPIEVCLKMPVFRFAGMVPRISVTLQS